MHPEAQLPIDDQALAAFRERNHIRRLAFSGSILGSDCRPDSDVDILVEFEPAMFRALLSPDSKMNSLK